MDFAIHILSLAIPTAAVAYPLLTKAKPREDRYFLGFVLGFISCMALYAANT